MYTGWVESPTHTASGSTSKTACKKTVPFDPASLPPEQVSQAAIDELIKLGVVEKGDWVILTKGDSYHTTGGTNGMKILHVGDPQV